MEGTEDWLVEDIIDLESKTWIKDLIEELFSDMEADLIFRIPLSLRPCEDRVLWHFDRKGTYNVKSGYNVARITQGVHMQASSSRGTGMGIGKLWNKIWQARTPPKVRVFIWRLLKGIIPTKCALEKKVKLPDMDCIFCKDQAESDDHLFRLCTVIDSFWLASPACAIPRKNHACNLFDWIAEVVLTSNNVQIDNFLTCLWVIWKERNNLMWNGGCFDPIFLAKWADNYLANYQKLHPLQKINKKRSQTHWECPPSGRLKMNIDGNYHAESARGGIGGVIRDEQGQFVAAFAKHLPYVSSSLQVELEACRAGMLFAIHQGWPAIEMETNHMQLGAIINNLGEDWSGVSSIVEDCKEYRNAFTSFQFRHIFRKANGVALRLAHFASFSAMDEFWLVEAPSIIEDVLYEDFCNCTRGSGMMSPSMYNRIHP